MTNNREEWLDCAVDSLRPYFKSIDKTVPKVRVSVGWPSTGGLGVKKRTIGQCWFGAMAEDGIPQLFISPLLDDPIDPMGVLPTLLHELIHVVAGPDAKHGPKFAKLARQMGLEGKPTSTNAGKELIERLAETSKFLGAFPHSKLIPTAKNKVQGTRMLKCECAGCGYVARTVRKWLDAQGAPICPCNNEPMSFDDGN